MRALLAVIAVLAGAEPGNAQALAVDAELSAAPKDGGLRHWEAVSPTHLRSEPGPDGAERKRIEPGMILSNLGCVDELGVLWCHVRPLHSGTKGYVEIVHLAPALGPDGAVARGPDDSSRRARRRDFDATTQIACAQEQGQPLGSCKAEIAGSGGGDATLVVTFPNGFARKLSFVYGHFVKANATMSGSGRDTDWSIEAGVHEIRVDDQQYRVPVSLVLGR